MARKYRKDLTADRLRELLRYDPDMGIFTWRVDRGVNRCAGKSAGTPDAEGHLMIRVDYVIYKAHRLAWLYMTGEWPAEVLDHENRIRGDNRWSNIRDANDQKNGWNSASRLPKTGFRGVTYQDGRFHAKLWEGKRCIRIGSFKTAEEASAAHIAAVSQRGKFACTATYKPTGGS